MEIKESKNNAVVIGDTQRNKVSIDVENINFITTLLSSNLYSNPEESFIRETVSNAWDSHVEAHKEDVPVVIVIGDDFICIRDYGVGISPERFEKIYLNIGSSTKRKDNTQLGGFGIGRFSALACSNMVFITSYYNNIKYQYLMIKDGNSINIDLIDKSVTEEDNGVEVRINNINSYNFSKYLGDLAFFPNLYVKGNGNRYNEIKIKHYNKFSVASYSSYNYILLGNVIYPLQLDKLSYQYRNLYNTFLNSSYLYVKFNIGEIDITPNRENILYSSNTIKVIEDRIKEAAEEMCDIAAKDIVKDYSDFGDYLDSIYGGEIQITLLKTDCNDIISIINTYSVKDNLSSRNEPVPTYKGKSIDNDTYYWCYNNLKYRKMPFFLGILDNGAETFYIKRIPWRLESLNRITSKRIIILKKDVKLYNAVKNYLRSKYSEGCYLILKDFTLEEYKEVMKNDILTADTFKRASMEEVYYQYYNSIKNRAIYFDDSDPEFIKFKKENKNVPVKKEGKEVTIKIYGEYSYSFGSPKRFCNIYDALLYISGLKKGVIITNKRDDCIEILSEIAKDRGLYIAAVNLNLLSEFKTVPNYINPYLILGKNSNFIKNLITLKNLPNKGFNIIDKYKYYINSTDYDMINLLKKWYRKLDNYTLEKYISTVYQDDDTIYNKYFEKCYSVYLNYIEDLSNFDSMIDVNRCDDDIISYLLIKYKKFRISMKAYKELKSSSIVKLLRK